MPRCALYILTGGHCSSILRNGAKWCCFSVRSAGDPKLGAVATAIARGEPTAGTGVECEGDDRGRRGGWKVW